MCELFAMSSRSRSAVTYSLNEFAENGSALRSNRSGWGVAYAHDRDAFVVKEAAPAASSPWVDFIASQRLESKYVMAHVRYATRGEPYLENTHPFRRAFGGRVHLFAHNGTLHGLEDDVAKSSLTHHPVGETDSELAFCILLENLRSIWLEVGDVPPVEDRMRVFVDFASRMKTFGSSNFLYFDGDALFVHGHRRIYEEDGKLTEPKPPGLHIKNCQRCAAAPEYECNGLRIEQHEQNSILFASVPLEADGWEALPEGTALVVKDGVELDRVGTA